MPLVTSEELKSADKRFNHIGGSFLVKFFMKFTALKKLNTFYASIKHIEGQEGVQAIIDNVGFKCDINPEGLEYIPKEGPFIIIANHPFGAAEGLILVNQICKVRPDMKVLVNFMLSRAQNIKEFWLGVNPFEDRPGTYSSITGLKQAYKHINDGHPVALFPAGEVSTWQSGSYGITDKSWNQPVMKFVQNAHVPIVPIYFHGKNSIWFHTMGLIHPFLRTLRLPRELLNKKGKTITMRIGPAIDVKNQAKYDYKDLIRFLRLKTYALELAHKDLEKKSTLFAAKTPEPVAEPIPVDQLIAEIEILRENKENLILDDGTYELYVARADQMPNLMLEIARLREISFREVGEGTGQDMDLDHYDKSYHQLFIWDKKECKMVGAYRIGVGSVIVKDQDGTKGFYTNSLFKINQIDFVEQIPKCQELGRSFIVKAYQRKTTPLLLLWKGLLHLMLKYDSRYVLGAVSISGEHSNFAKALTMLFVRTNYYDPDWARFFKRRNRMPIKLPRNFDSRMFLRETDGSFDALDIFIKGINPNYRTPVLVRQYIGMLNAKGIGFNIDPNFNNCLDVLMVLDLFNAPYKTIAMLGKGLPLQDELERLLSVLE